MIDDGLVQFKVAMESYASKSDLEKPRSGHENVDGIPMGPNIIV
jgi:hypothetical protein